MKKFLILTLIAGVIVGGYYLFRIVPLLTTDNTGADKVVLLHGLGRSETAMLLMESGLTEAGFDVYSIGYDSIDQAPPVALQKVSTEIGECCVEGPETVHFVGHSLGGLLIRAYLGKHPPANLGRVVLLGTPNKGSELADRDDDEALQDTLLELAGPTARSLGTGPTDFAGTLPAPYYPVGIIAGTRDSQVANKWLPVPNDGMVSVESARLEGMADFVTFDLRHWDLRGNQAVIGQVVHFLMHGKFDHAEER